MVDRDLWSTTTLALRLRRQALVVMMWFMHIYLFVHRECVHGSLVHTFKYT